MHKRIAVAVLVATALMAAPSDASAATQIGQTFPGVPTFPIPCVAPSTYFQQSTGPASPSYAVPAGGGVITSWSVKTLSGDAGKVKLGVLRNAGAPSKFTTIGASAAETLPGNSLNSFGTRVPAQAGDRIGVLIISGSYACADDDALGFDMADVGQRDAVAVHDTGATFTYSNPSPNTRINIRATVQPDADKDGFGDETQDQCLGQAGPNNGCPPPPAPSPAAAPAAPPAAAAATCKDKSATIVGTDSADKLTGTPAADVVGALGGNDKVSGLAGNDVICGGPGKDTLNGGGGKDRLLGQGGKDVCTGGKGKDTAKCEVEKSI